jgi:hypothetical protein
VKTGSFGDHAEPDMDDEPDLTDDFEIEYIFEAQFRGHCTIDREHEYRRGQKVGRVRHASNPMLPIQGVACSNCIKIFPHAERR